MKVKKFDPKVGQRYWYITSLGAVFSGVWTGDGLVPFGYRNFLGIYRTKKEALFVVKFLKKTVQGFYVNRL